MDAHAAQEDDEGRLLRKRLGSLRHSMQQWGEDMCAFLTAERFAEVEEAQVACELVKRAVRRLPAGGSAESEHSRMAMVANDLGRLQCWMRAHVMHVSAKVDSEAARAWELQVESVGYFRRKARQLRGMAEKSMRPPAAHHS